MNAYFNVQTMRQICEERNNQEKKNGGYKYPEEECGIGCKVIVNYIPRAFDNNSLRELFSSIGKVQHSVIVKDKVSNESLGYGFVTYTNPDDAIFSILRLNRLKLFNKTIKVALARPQSDEIKNTNLFISGLPNSMTDDRLEGIFEKYGRILDFKLIRPSVVKDVDDHKSVALVRYDKRSEANRVIGELNQKIPQGLTRPICVKYKAKRKFNDNKNRMLSIHQPVIQSVNPQQFEMPQPVPTAPNYQLTDIFPLPTVLRIDSSYNDYLFPAVQKRQSQATIMNHFRDPRLF